MTDTTSGASSSAISQRNKKNRARDYMMSLFQGGSSINTTTTTTTTTTTNKQGAQGKLYSAGVIKNRDDELAFDNPYFKGDDYLHFAARQQQARQQLQLNDLPPDDLILKEREQQVIKQAHCGLLTTTTGENKQLSGDRQLDFIENHISNLHNRQVTSSVKELSIFGGGGGGAQPDHSINISPQGVQLSEVVDLTGDRYNQREIQQGDLMAVDITGSDLVGLGFEVCGDAHEGIFVKSVLSRGPARETGSIQPGDKIKCLNVTFDSMTLQDAYDILNCASPYKMRLLLEKQAIPISSKQFEMLRSSLILRQASAKKFFASSLERQKEPKNSYIRKLTNFVSPSQLKSNPSYTNALQAAKISAQMYLGSAAAREHLTRDLPLTNSRIYSDTISERYDDSKQCPIVHHRSNEFQPEDSSLDYENKNANHKLHGPIQDTYNQSKLFQKNNNKDNFGRFSASEEPLRGCDLAGCEKRISIKQNTHNRRQSEANIPEKENSDFRRPVRDSHLVQTQSQPEIATTIEAFHTLQE